MEQWKNIKINGIATIEKCIGEFNVFELIKTPYGKFKVKVYEKPNGTYIGYTNLQLKDEEGCLFSGVGHGKTISETLEDTIQYFIKMLDEKQNLSEEDFVCSDSYDF